MTAEERDTWQTWGIAAHADQVYWLEQETSLSAEIFRALLEAQVRHGRGNVPRRAPFRDLRPEVKTARFLWSPDQLTPAVLKRLFELQQPCCQRELVPKAAWQAAQTLLPRAHELAGTFPKGSGGNCFGTVMGAAGIVAAEEEWVQREPFEDFLTERSRAGGRDEDPGTLLIWRGQDGQVEHAAMSLGGGWAFHKASQSWQSPRVGLPLKKLILTSRMVGQRLERRQLVDL